MGAANRTEECSAKFSEILAVSGRRGSGSLKNGEVMTYSDTNSSSRTHARTDISTDRCTDSGLRDRLSIDSHNESSSSSSSSSGGMGAESPYTKAVNRFLDRNSRTSPLENILLGEDSRKILPQDSLPVMENVPSKSISRKTRDAIIVSVIKSLDVGKNTDLNRVNSTGSIPNQITNSSYYQNNNHNNSKNINQNIERALQAENDFYNSENSLRSISEKIQRNVQESFENNNTYRRK